MERNKMEEEFRRQLNQREITPSNHAWDRLDAMLNSAEDEKEKPVRKLGWLYIAAGFIGIILVGTMFFKSSETKTGNGVAVEDVSTNPKQNIPTATPKDSVEKINQQQQITPTQAEVAVSQSKPFNQQIKTHKIALSNTIQQTQIAQVENKQPVNNQASSINQQQIINHQSTNPVNANADEQIVSADVQIQKPKTIKVDAHSLLAQVDGELELSFREKVIKTVSKKYQNVKVALANRNQQ